MANSPAPDPLGIPADPAPASPLDRAVAKAYRRLLP